jgi:hypothetical protein
MSAMCTYSVNRDTKGIFHRDPLIPVSIREAREAYDACHRGRRYDVYDCFYLDGEMVEKYIHVIEELEHAYEMSNGRILFKFNIGKFTIVIQKP